MLKDELEALLSQLEALEKKTLREGRRRLVRVVSPTVAAVSFIVLVAQAVLRTTNAAQIALIIVAVALLVPSAALASNWALASLALIRAGSKRLKLAAWLLPVALFSLAVLASFIQALSNRQPYGPIDAFGNGLFGLALAGYFIFVMTSNSHKRYVEWQTRVFVSAYEAVDQQPPAGG